MNLNLKSRNVLAVLILLACLALSAACLVYPIYVIRPFRAQGARELSAALEVIRFRPVIILFTTLAAIALAAWSWRSLAGRWSRAGIVTLAVLVCLSGALTRVNIYELMFHPMGQGSFIPVAQTKLDGDEKVIAVKIGNSARAYPIRSISYHHVVNDEVEKRAIVATY